MKYNTEVSNDQPLPIAYVHMCGEHLQVKNLYTGKILALNVLYIQITKTGQLSLRCVDAEDGTDTGDFIFDTVPGLLIKPKA
jgi:hypothetical protein